jgi:hypothetical protein
LEEAGAGIGVADEKELAERLLYFLNHPQEADAKGEAGRQVLRSQMGLTQKAAEIICDIIPRQ